MTCVDGKTGKRVWQERMDAIFSASPALANGQNFIRTDGHLYCLGKQLEAGTTTSGHGR